MDNDLDVIPLISFGLLIASEILPFITSVDGNGVAHTIVAVIIRTLKTCRKELVEEAAKEPVTLGVDRTLIPKG